MRMHMNSLVMLTAAVTVTLFSMPLQADIAKLWRLTCDHRGNCDLLFSVMDADNNPIDDTGLALPDIRLEIGAQLNDLEEVELEEGRLQTLADWEYPLQVRVLLPNVELFNGLEGDSAWPDASGIRSALVESLETIPQRRSNTVQIGLYNDAITWLPEVDTTQLEEVRAALLGTDDSTRRSYPRTGIEDPFAAIDWTYRNELRRQAREPGGNDFVHFFIVVTSSQSPVTGTAGFEDAIEEYRQALDNMDMIDVIPLFIVYDPSATDEELNDPEGEHLRFAQGLTPDRGTYRLANDEPGFRHAIEQTVEQIASSFFLTVDNNPLAAGSIEGMNYVRLSFDGPDERYNSNAFQVYVPPPTSSERWHIVLVFLLASLPAAYFLIRRGMKDVAQKSKKSP